MAILQHDIGSGGVIDHTQLDQNFEALEAAIEGNLTEANLSASTQIPNSMLANNDFILTIELHVESGGWVATNDAPMAVAGLPYDATEGNTSYSIIAAYATSRNASATTPAFTIEWGHASGGLFVTSAGAGGSGVVIVNSNSLSSAGGFLGPTTMTVVGSSVTTNSAQPRCFAIVNDGGAAGITTAGDFLNVTLKLKRELRS